jgi:hypothetical protein
MVYIWAGWRKIKSEFSTPPSVTWVCQNIPPTIVPYLVLVLVSWTFFWHSMCVYQHGLVLNKITIKTLRWVKGFSVHIFIVDLSVIIIFKLHIYYVYSLMDLNICINPLNCHHNHKHTLTFVEGRVWEEFLRSTLLTNFAVYNALLFTIGTMLYSRSPFIFCNWNFMHIEKLTAHFPLFRSWQLPFYSLLLWVTLF